MSTLSLSPLATAYCPARDADVSPASQSWLSRIIAHREASADRCAARHIANLPATVRDRIDPDLLKRFPHPQACESAP